MEGLELPQEDMEFLNKVCGPERTPELQASISALEQAAISGDEEAKLSLEMVLVAEATQNEFNADAYDMMADSVAACRMFLPELITRTHIDAVFESQFARLLQAIQRSAWARGWIARERRME